MTTNRSTDTTTAARIARVSITTIRTWCRIGAVSAVKSDGKWIVDVASLRRRVVLGRRPLSPRRPADRLRKGAHAPVLTGRAARRQVARSEARRVADKYGSRVIGHVERARIAAANSGQFLSRDYLTGLGFDAEFVSRYESAFGRETAKQYRLNHGAEPDNGGKVVLRGRIWHANRYADAADLLAGARAYKRTAVVLLEREAQDLAQSPAPVVA